MDMWGSHVEGIYEYPRLDYVSSSRSTAITDEEAPGEAELETNDDGYPLLPENTMELGLEHKKKLLRRYMASTRSKSSPCMHVPSLIVVGRFLQTVRPYSLDQDLRPYRSFSNQGLTSWQ